MRKYLIFFEGSFFKGVALIIGVRPVSPHAEEMCKKFMR